MKCARPFRSGVQEYGCGQCAACRIRKRREWTGRLLLESTQHDVSSFVTLTYEEATRPVEGVNREDYQGFLKRLRYHYGGPIRYYICGEYGGRTARPHYHAALFGVGPEHEDLIRDCWKLGHTHVGDVTRQSMSYNCSHLTKRKPRVGEVRDDGQNREFARMSLRPGIGATAIRAIGDWCHTRAGVDFMARSGDVPSTFRFDGRIWPLGRYLTGVLREYVGHGKGAPVDKERLRALERIEELVAKGSLYFSIDNELEVERAQDQHKARFVFSRGKVSESL